MKKETELNDYVDNFSVYDNFIGNSNSINVHKYLIKKDNMK